MQAEPPKIIVTQTGLTDTVKTGVGKVEQELVLGRKQEDVEGDERGCQSSGLACFRRGRRQKK